MSSFNGWQIVTLPTTPPPKSIEWELSDVVGENASPFAEQSQFQDWQQSRMRASVSYQPMTDAQARPWIAFLMSCRGKLSVFSFGDPLHTKPANTSYTAGAVSGANQTGYTLVTTSSGLLPGDWFSLGLRLYMITSASGGTLGIWPPLRESPANGTSLVVVNATGLFRLKSNVRKYSENELKLYGFNIEIEEAL